MRVPRGGAILYARGNAGTRLAAEAAVGTSLTVRAILPSPFSTAVSGIGGGPLLVKNRKAVFRANEAFGAPLAHPAHRPDGGGTARRRQHPARRRRGRTARVERRDDQLRAGADPCRSRRCTTAMGLDGGADAAMAFEGSLLSRPTQGEKPIGNAFALLYSGVYAPPVDDLGSAGQRRHLAGIQARQAVVRQRVLDGPGSANMTIDSRERPAGVYSFPWRGLDSGGRRGSRRPLDLESDGDRRSRPPVRGRACLLVQHDPRRASPSIAASCAAARRSASPSISPGPRRSPCGSSVAEPSCERSSSARPIAGKTTVSWNGRLGGKLSASRGSYLVRATATNQVGTTELTATVRRARR